MLENYWWNRNKHPADTVTDYLETLLGNDVHTAAADVKSTTCEPEPAADFEKTEDYGFDVLWKESWRHNSGEYKDRRMQTSRWTENQNIWFWRVKIQRMVISVSYHVLPISASRCYTDRLLNDNSFKLVSMQELSNGVFGLS